METQVVFCSQQQAFSLPINEVEKIIQMEPVTVVPNCAEFILGVIDYDGGVLPVIDLAERLYQRRTTIDMDSKIIIVSWQDQLVGFLVETVQGIKGFDPTEYLSVKESQLHEASYLVHFIKDGEKIILQLDINKLLMCDLNLGQLITEEELSELNSTMDSTDEAEYAE